MMRLALAAVLLPAASAAPTCTDASCCVPMVQGMCSGNTHDAAGKGPTDTGYTIADVTPVDCSSGDGTTAANTLNKGSTITGRTAAACCGPQPTADPTWGCDDKSGDDAATADPVTDTDCGAGWGATGATTALTAAFDVTLEAHKQACCTACTGVQFATATTACADHTTAACAAGSGWSGSTTEDNGACAACPAGKATAGVAGESCETCAAGKIPTDGVATTTMLASGATTCSDCAGGKFSTAPTTDCANHATPTCAAGKGKVAGTTSVDAHCADCVAGTTWNNANDDSVCATNTATCGTVGQGLVVSTSATADSTCENCPVNTYAAAGDDSCKEDCADGKEIKNAAGTVATTTGETCTDCASGFFDDDGIPSTECAAVATGASAITACAAGKGFVAASTTADAHCVDCVAGTNFDNTAAQAACVAITPTTCAAGTGYASDATATTDDTAAACTACTAGKFSAGTQAVCADCPAGSWSAASATSCTACASGLTVAAGAGTAATDCVADSSMCLLASADDDTDSDTDGQPFACSSGKYVASNVKTPVVAQVHQCTAVPATGAAITSVPTTCTPVLAEEAATQVDAVNIGAVTIVLTGPDTTATTAVTGRAANDAVAASCTLATGAGGSCTLAEPVTASGGVDTTCPEPVVEQKTSGAAAAAPLAFFAAVVAIALP